MVHTYCALYWILIGSYICLYFTANGTLYPALIKQSKASNEITDERVKPATGCPFHDCTLIAFIVCISI